MVWTLTYVIIIVISDNIILLKYVLNFHRIIENRFSIFKQYTLKKK